MSEKRFYVTYCSRTKSELKRGTPELLYQSDRVKCFFKYFPKPRAILSYKYGIIFENEVIDNYEQKGFGQNYRDCVLKVEQVLKNYEVVFYSPRALVEKPWIKLLDDAGIYYIIIRRWKDILENKADLRKFLEQLT